MNHKCRHPRVQIVAREEDSEFVECLECREVFESSEFKDMAIEDSALDEARSPDGNQSSFETTPWCAKFVLWRLSPIKSLKNDIDSL